MKNILIFIRETLNSFSNKEGFARKSLILTLGTGLSQVIPVLFTPLLTRLFTPVEFGFFAIISSITAIISVISMGKYESVVLIAKNDSDAANIVVFSLIISFLVSTLALIVLFLVSDSLISIMKQPRLEFWIYICPLTSFLISIYQVYNEWCIRRSQFIQLSYNKIINSGAITFSNLSFGLLKVSSGGLILGELIGRLITAVVAIFNTLKEDFELFLGINKDRMVFLAKKYINAPKYIMPGQLINTLAGHGVVLLIASFFGEKEVGYYSITGMALSVPATLISLAIRDVFKNKANDEYTKNKNALSIYKKTLKITTVFSVLIFTFLFIVLPDLFSFIFGKDWRIAGEYARILSPAIMISFIAESVWGMFIIAEKMKEIFIWQTQFLFFTILSVLFGYYYFETMEMVLICYAIGRSFVYLISIKKTYKYAGGEGY